MSIFPSANTARAWDDDRVSLDEIKQRLNDQIEGVVAALGLTPAPETRNRKDWKFPHSGGAWLVVRGNKKGSFHCFTGNDKGSALDLIKWARSCNLADAIAWARSFLGISEDEPLTEPDPVIILERERKLREAEAQAASDDALAIAAARALWAASVPLAGTPGELYLAGSRAIAAPATGWPEAVRYHPGRRAVIVVATTRDDGGITAVQLIHVTADGRKIDRAECDSRHIPHVKQTRGRLAGAVVRLPGPADGPLLLGEGPETGMSVWGATGHETWIALGSITGHKPPSCRRVVICRDDDKRFSPADRALSNAVATWRAAGVNLAVATPWPFRRQDKTDLNDTIRDGGPEAVRTRIDAALAPAAARTVRTPRPEADRQLDAAVAALFEKADCRDPGAKDAPPVQAIRYSVGGGKTHAARNHSIKLLKKLRARKDKRVTVLAVPTRKLGDEQAIKFETDVDTDSRGIDEEIAEALAEAESAGLRAYVWRGREAPIPEDEHLPKTGNRRTMCNDLDRIKDAEDALDRASCISL